MKKLLFINHEASLTGAPLVLLYFMEWLYENHRDEYELGILHLKGGELESKFNSLVKYSYKFGTFKKSKAFKLANKLSLGQLAKRQPSEKTKIIKNIASEKFDFIYANTVKSISIASDIKNQTQNQTKLIAHIHELNVIIKQSEIPENVIKNIDHTIAVSELVRSNLIAAWNLSKDKISMVYEFSKIDLSTMKHKIQTKQFTVGASGFVHWRKGHDVFIQVARYLKDNYPSKKIKFIWVGKINKSEKYIINEDLKKLDLMDTVNFVGEHENPFSCFNEFDVFLMTSREDPFPLVCIEVGILGKPIICFDQATGTQELLKNGGGKIVPYLNVEKMCEALVSYHDDEKLLKRDSEMAKKMFNKFSPEVKCPEIFEIIKKVKRA